MKNLAVIGMGYVGIPVACEFAKKGLLVCGIDLDGKKTEKINRGIYPFSEHEPGIGELLSDAIGKGTLSASTSPDGIKDADAVIICVQTPFSDEKREPDYAPLKSAVQTVGRNMKKGALVVVESTIAPGTMGSIVLPALESSSKMKAGKDFLLAHCPERVTPGRLLLHLRTMDRMVGGFDEKSTQAALSLYTGLTSGKLHPMNMLMAELVKTTENAYRDMQIGFANQMALACQGLGLDVHELRKYVNTCPERNMHEPGIGVGGHCIPKDPLLLMHGLKGKCELPITREARRMNEGMPGKGAELVQRMLKEKGIEMKDAQILVLGVAYLANSDDTRNSPGVALAKILQEKGAHVRIYDPCAKADVPGAEVFGNLQEAASGADCIALTVAHREFLHLAGEEGLAEVGKLLRMKIIMDGRNVFNPKLCKRKGYSFCGIGKEFLV